MSGEWIARYMRYGCEGQQEADNLSEAIGILAWGWERSELAEIDILDPSGNVALTGDELFRAMMDRLGA